MPLSTIAMEDACLSKRTPYLAVALGKAIAASVPCGKITSIRDLVALPGCPFSAALVASLDASSAEAFSPSILHLAGEGPSPALVLSGPAAPAPLTDPAPFSGLTTGLPSGTSFPRGLALPREGAPGLDLSITFPRKTGIATCSGFFASEGFSSGAVWGFSTFTAGVGAAAERCPPSTSTMSSSSSKSARYPFLASLCKAS
mmetsp:Transcript_12094/g.44881  ORF Transcript_12094/g.44881 Transcript_12094/m.44881 type:complete len:201 (-) Transcript_12094:1574-2176(-)